MKAEQFKFILEASLSVTTQNLWMQGPAKIWENNGGWERGDKNHDNMGYWHLVRQMNMINNCLKEEIKECNAR